MTAIGAFGEVATARKPGGSCVTRSPWLIHTGYFSPFRHTPAKRAAASVSTTSARPWPGGRPARQDHRLGPHRRKRFRGFLIRNDLAIDPLLAHAARDELSHLRAEVDDEDFVVGRGGPGCF